MTTYRRAVDAEEPEVVSPPPARGREFARRERWRDRNRRGIEGSRGEVEMEMRYGGVECRRHWACCAVGSENFVLEM